LSAREDTSAVANKTYCPEEAPRVTGSTEGNRSGREGSYAY